MIRNALKILHFEWGELQRNFTYSISWHILAILFASYFLTSCNRPTVQNDTAPILLFNGTGSSQNDVNAIVKLLTERHFAFAKVNSDQLNNMTMSQLRSHRLLIVPGGHYIHMGDSLTANARKNVRDAVHNGLNYLGICAGGLLAGEATCNSFNLTSGVRFDFYSVVSQGIHKAPVWIEIAGSSPQEHYWEDGPQLSGWGDAVGSYPDKTPAIVEGDCGKGWVVLCGMHPEAPESWRSGMSFTTPARVNNEFAVKLIEAALNATLFSKHKVTSLEK